MKPEIPLDDPMYASKHVDRVGWSWYLLIGLLLIAWLITFVMMVNKDEFSLWPLAFFVGACVAAHKVGMLLKANGYLTPEERRKALDEKAKDRENA